MTIPRITAGPALMGGVPCIRGFRMPVATIVGMLAGGMTQAEILEAHPWMEAEDITEALRFAAQMSNIRDLPLAPSA